MLVLSEANVVRYPQSQKMAHIENRSPTIFVEFTDRQVNKFILRMESSLIGPL